nr:uncharacterized protein LOC125421676 [Ziziphus jujuba var. spinosa]
MKEIVRNSEKMDKMSINEQVAFPRLQCVTIRGMNKSKIIANNAEVFGKLEEVDVQVRNCNNLMKIFTSSMQRALGSLRRLDISSCEMVEEIFEMRTLDVECRRTYTRHNTLSVDFFEFKLFTKTGICMGHRSSRNSYLHTS